MSKQNTRASNRGLVGALHPGDPACREIAFATLHAYERVSMKPKLDFNAVDSRTPSGELTGNNTHAPL